MAQNMTAWVLTLVVTAIVGGVGLLVLQNFQKNISDTNSAAYQGVGYGITGVSDLLQWLPTVAIVVAGAVILYIVTRSFGTGGAE